METTANSALESAGPQSIYLEHLWWLMLAVCTVVFVIVLALLVIAMLRKRDADSGERPQLLSPRGALQVVAAGAALTGVILFGLLIASIFTDRDLDRIETANALTLTITGQQWWWDVRYEDAQPSNIVVTANEIHIPVGRPVHLRLRATDVIHSFWVPSLAGKKDLIPGRDTSLWIQADRAGIYQGQCAEFCGYQHAHMRMLVVADSPQKFQSWLERQRAMAREPTTPEQKRGREVFLATTCVMCHSVRGTPAGSRAGPDLTHLASRQTIAAGAAPNTKGYLAGWLLDPQSMKPGTRMPANPLEAADLHALLAYLTSLE